MAIPAEIRSVARHGDSNRNSLLVANLHIGKCSGMEADEVLSVSIKSIPDTSQSGWRYFPANPRFSTVMGGGRSLELRSHLHDCYLRWPRDTRTKESLLIDEQGGVLCLSRSPDGDISIATRNRESLEHGVLVIIEADHPLFGDCMQIFQIMKSENNDNPEKNAFAHLREMDDFAVCNMPLKQA